MRTFIVILLLAGCANKPSIVEAQLPLPVAVTVPDEPSNDRRATQITRHPAPAPQPVKKLPPCEFDPTDARTAILQKMDCLIESKTKVPPKPIH